jgi:hypothetical protein
MDFASLIIQLVSGAVGGNLVGQAFKDQSLGIAIQSRALSAVGLEASRLKLAA